jgi:outer membrane protein assembly factor BamB
MFLTTNYGKLYCVDAIGGGGKWDLQFGGSFSAPQIGPTGIVYFGSNAPYGFYAVDVVAKMQKFHYDLPGDAATVPALANGLVYFIDSTNSRLYALDAITGAHEFDVPVMGGASGSPVVGVDIVYVATKTNGVAAFDAMTGEAKWQEPQGVGVVQPALLSTGHVVTSSIDGAAVVLARTSGATKFSAALNAAVMYPPVIDADDNIYFATDAATVSFTNKLAYRWDAAVFGRISIGDNRVIVLPSNNMLALIGD